MTKLSQILSMHSNWKINTHYRPNGWGGANTTPSPALPHFGAQRLVSQNAQSPKWERVWEGVNNAAIPNATVRRGSLAKTCEVLKTSQVCQNDDSISLTAP